MKSIDDRLVLVPASALGDLVETSALAAERLGATVNDPLAQALRGAVAAVRVESTYEP